MIVNRLYANMITILKRINERNQHSNEKVIKERQTKTRRSEQKRGKIAIQSDFKTYVSAASKHTGYVHTFEEAGKKNTTTIIITNWRDRDEHRRSDLFVMSGTNVLCK